MDLLPAIVAQAPSLGVGGVLVLLVLYLLRAQAGERDEYRTALADVEKAHAAELDRERGRARELSDQVDAERRRRFEAEERAATVRWPIPSAPHPHPHPRANP